MSGLADIGLRIRAEHVPTTTAALNRLVERMAARDAEARAKALACIERAAKALGGLIDLGEPKVVSGGGLFSLVDPRHDVGQVPYPDAAREVEATRKPVILAKPLKLRPARADVRLL